MDRFLSALILGLLLLGFSEYVNADTTFIIGFDGLTQQTNTYTEDGFVLTCDAFPHACAFNVGFTVGNPPPNMFPASTFQVNTLARQNNGEFDLISMDVRELSTCCVNSKPINFTAVKMAGGTVSQTFNTDGTFGWQTFVFSGFTNIISVSWDLTNPDFPGAFDNIVLEIADGTPTNTPPVANNATFDINEGESLSGQLTASDSDSSNQLTFSLVSGTSNGEIVVNSDGNFTYQPDTNFNGQDTATFEVSDGKAQDQGTITINIAPVNDVPVCSDAKASVTSMWPPNHKMKSVTVNMEVTDVDGDVIVVFISSIFQDEPTNGLGDGDTSPDAQIISQNSVNLRAERAGDEDGRVYIVTTSADDGNGGTCSDSVVVGVPHDQSSAAIDSGVRFDSTQP